MGWPIVRLGDVLRLDIDRVPIKADNNYPMAGVLSFGAGLFKREPLSGMNTSYKHLNQLAEGHVVMSQLFGWEGALAICPPDFEGTFVSPQFPTFRSDPSRIQARFLAWLLKRRWLWDQLSARAKGMGDRRRTVTPEALLGIDLPLPTLSEQERLASRIDALARQIEEAQQIKLEVSAKCQALCRAMVFGKHAKETPMRDILKPREPDTIVSHEVIYKFAGVYSFGRGVFRSAIKSGADFAYSRLTKIRAGNFIYPKLMAWEGALGAVPPECDGYYVSPEFPVFEPILNRVLPETLDVYFRSPAVWPQLAAISTGTNVRRRRLHPSAFLSYKMSLPPMQAQLRLKSVMAELNRTASLQAEISAKLDSLLPSIIDRAFKGSGF